MNPQLAKVWPCLDCGTETLYDVYIVRSKVWEEAGMIGWGAGFLCTPCIEKRLGRKLRKKKDLLAWTVGPKRGPKGFKMQYVADYLTSPEFLDHPSDD